MKKLNFKLKNNNIIEIDEICDYQIIDKYIVFSFHNYKFKIKSEVNYLYFERDDKDNIFKIEYNNKKVNSCIILKNPEFTADILTYNFNYSMHNNKILFNYNIESDENNLKTIIITFLE